MVTVARGWHTAKGAGRGGGVPGLWPNRPGSQRKPFGVTHREKRKERRRAGGGLVRDTRDRNLEKCGKSRHNREQGTGGIGADGGGKE